MAISVKELELETAEFLPDREVMSTTSCRPQRCEPTYCEPEPPKCAPEPVCCDPCKPALIECRVDGLIHLSVL
jgi:hypothetical protein